MLTALFALAAPRIGGYGGMAAPMPFKGVYRGIFPCKSEAIPGYAKNVKGRYPMDIRPFLFFPGLR